MTRPSTGHAAVTGPENRTRSLAAVGVAIALLAAAVPSAQTLGTAPPAAHAAPGRAEARVNVDLDNVIGDLPRDFLGLSFEKSILSNDSLDPSSGNLSQLLSTLSPQGHLRFGGNQMDEGTWWQPGEREEPSWARWVVDRPRIDALADLTEQTGWDVEMGVNLRRFDEQSTRDEARYLGERLGSSLVGIACGNEIDLFPGGRDWTAQRPLWQQCADTVTPHANLLGGDEADGLRPEMLDTVGDQLSLATSHYYAQYENCFPGNGPDGRRPFELTSLLTPETVERTATRTERQIELARSAGLPFRYTESNSAACLRQENIGNVYAAALWAVDHQLLVGSLGVDGVNMHVPFDEWHLCSRTVTYSALCAPTPEALERNELRVNPLYYGMLTVGTVEPGSFLATTVSSETNTTAYAVRADNGDLQLVVVQKDAPGGTPVDVRIPGIIGSGPARTMQLTAPSLTAGPDQITLQGAQVELDGTFQPGPAGTVSSNRGGYTVPVPTGSATVVTIENPRAVRGCTSWPDPSVSIEAQDAAGDIVVSGPTTIGVRVENTTSCQLLEVETSLAVPSGWTADPTSPSGAARLTPGSTFTAQYRITPPPSARDVTESLTAHVASTQTGTAGSTAVTGRLTVPCDAGGARVEGRIGAAVGLCGSGQHVTLPSGIVSGLQDATIAGWVNPAANTRWSRVFDFGTGETTNMFLTLTSGSGMRFSITDSGGANENRLNWSGTLPVNTWSHVAVTLSGDTATLYVDGQSVATSTITLDPDDLGTTTNNWIGRSQYDDPTMDAKVDDVQIYSEALTAARVADLASGTAGSGDVASYRFDEDEGSIAVDSSGNGRDGTIIDPTS